MKKILTSTLFSVGRVYLYLVPYSLKSIWKRMRIYLYTGYVTRQFKHFGKSIVQLKFRNLRGEDFISIGDGCIVSGNVCLAARPEYKTRQYSKSLSFNTISAYVA